MAKRRGKEKKCMRYIYTAFKKKYNKLPPYDELIKLDCHPEKILSIPALANAIFKVSKMNFKKAVYDIRAERDALPEDQQQEIFFVNEIIEKINSWGAVSILAHPYYEKDIQLTNDDVEKKIRLFSQYGIQGVEVFSGKLDKSTQAFLFSLCEKLSLFPSIGSDFHYQIKNLGQAEGIRKIKGNIGIDFHGQGKGLNPRYLDNVDLFLKKRAEEWIMNTD